MISNILLPNKNKIKFLKSYIFSFNKEFYTDNYEECKQINNPNISKDEYNIFRKEIINLKLDLKNYVDNVFGEGTDIFKIDNDFEFIYNINKVLGLSKNEDDLVLKIYSDKTLIGILINLLSGFVNIIIFGIFFYLYFFLKNLDIVKDDLPIILNILKSIILTVWIAFVFVSLIKISSVFICYKEPQQIRIINNIVNILRTKYPNYEFVSTYKFGKGFLRKVMIFKIYIKKDENNYE